MEKDREKPSFSKNDVKKYLKEEIARRDISMKQKLKTIEQMQQEIANDQQQISECKFVLAQIEEIYHSHNGIDGYRSMTFYLERRGYGYSAATIHKCFTIADEGKLFLISVQIYRAIPVPFFQALLTGFVFYIQLLLYGLSCVRHLPSNT